MRVPPFLQPVSRALLMGMARLLIALVRILPAPLAYGLGRSLARVVWRLTPQWRRSIDRNLQLFNGGAPLGEDTAAARQERARIGLASVINLGWYAIEFIRMGFMPPERALAMVVEEEGTDMLRAAVAEGRGVIVLGMHYGNWELCGAYINRNAAPLHAVGKEQRDALLTRLAFTWRERYGIRNIPVGDKANSAILRALKQGAILGLVADQNGGKAGVFAPFAGIAASTVTGPAVLALRTGAPLVVVRAERLSPGRLRFVAGPHIDMQGIPGHDVETGRYTDEAVVEVLTRINAAYEQIIRADPAQWLWGHKRWKTRPSGEESLYL